MDVSKRLNELNTKVLKVGDVASGSYLEVADDGTTVKHGSSTVFDDMLNNISSFIAEGDRVPIMKYFANDGQGTPNNARSFNGSSDYGEIDQPTINPSNFSFNVWIKPDDLEGQIIYIPDFVDFYFDGGKPAVDWDGFATQSSSVALSQNTWNMLTIVAEDVGSKVNMKMFINGVLNKEQERNGNLNTASGTIFVGKWTSGWFNKSVYDEMCAFSIPLTQLDIDGLYNGGSPTGIIEASILASAICHYKFNEASGSVIVNEIIHNPVRDLTLYTSDGVEGNIDVVSSIIGNTGSKGIALPHWGPNSITEMHLTSQTPHTRKALSSFLQHIHVIKPVDDTGYVCFGLEYAAIGITGVLQNTTTVKSYINKIGSELLHEHCLTEFNAEVDGTNLGISSILVGRLYRDTDWEDANDGQMVTDYTNPNYGTADYIPAIMDVLFEKYNHDIIVLASDAHIEKDTEGSKEPYLK